MANAKTSHKKGAGEVGASFSGGAFPRGRGASGSVRGVLRSRLRHRAPQPRDAHDSRPSGESVSGPTRRRFGARTLKPSVEP